MIHYRIIGSVWLLFGLTGLGYVAVDCLRLWRTGDHLPDGDRLSTLLVGGFLALAAATSVGLFRGRRWARIIFGIMAILFGLYCLSFLAMVGVEFGALDYTLSWLGVAFVTYALTVVLICKPDEQSPG